MMHSHAVIRDSGGSMTYTVEFSRIFIRASIVMRFFNFDVDISNFSLKTLKVLRDSNLLIVHILTLGSGG